MNKVALFDFCETIANFQTADAFVFYIVEKSNKRSVYLRSKIYSILNKLKITKLCEILCPKSSVNKRMVLYITKGLSKQEMEAFAKKYYLERVKPNLILPVLSKLVELKQEKYNIYIVSAGYEIYLKYFLKDFEIEPDHLISVKIAFKKGKCSGTFDGGDRLYDKTVFLDKLFDSKDVYSISFSDSKTDLPFLKLANDAYVVRKSGTKRWATDYNFKEIVW